MSKSEPLPEYSARRLLKVCIRSLHLVGIAGLFGATMMQLPAPAYTALALMSGVCLVVMDTAAGSLWFLQVRGLFFFLKMLALLLMHLHSELAIPCLITVVLLSGFIAHAPSRIRYFSLRHGKVVLSKNEILG